MIGEEGHLAFHERGVHQLAAPGEVPRLQGRQNAVRTEEARRHVAQAHALPQRRLPRLAALHGE